MSSTSPQASPVAPLAPSMPVEPLPPPPSPRPRLQEREASCLAESPGAVKLFENGGDLRGFALVLLPRADGSQAVQEHLVALVLGEVPLGALDQRGEDPVDALGGALGRGPKGGDQVLVARGVDAREEQQPLDRAGERAAARLASSTKPLPAPAAASKAASKSRASAGSSASRSACCISRSFSFSARGMGT